MRSETTSVAGARFVRALATAAAVLLLAMPMAAQTATRLDQNCTVSILNRNAVVAPDGTWLVPNIPAGFGQVRARATCVTPTGTKSGESPLFDVPVNGGIDVPAIVLGATTPIPQLITVTATQSTLTSPGATAQLTINGVYAGN